MDMPETPHTLLSVLKTRKKDWVSFPAEDKYMAALEIRSRVVQAAARWARIGASVRGTDKEHIASQELTLMLMPLANYLDGLLATLSDVKQGKAPACPPTTDRDGATVVRAYPWGTVERWMSILGWNMSTEVVIERGSSPLREPPTDGGEGAVFVVHGAGYNPVELLAACLHAAFVEGAVVGLVLSPVLGPFQVVMEYIMTPLGNQAFFASFVLDGSAAIDALPPFDTLLLVGHTPDTAKELVRQGESAFVAKGSLHGPTPWIVVPGGWSTTQLRHHALEIAEAVAYAGSASPYAPRIIFLPADWEQSDELIEEVKEELAHYKLPRCLVPEQHQSYAAFYEAYPDAWTSPAPARHDLPEGDTAVSPWAVHVFERLPDTDGDNLALTTDPRSPFVTFVKVPGSQDVPPDEALLAYLEKTVCFVNDHIAGSFGVTISIHPGTEKASGAALEWAISRLDYGVVTVNAPVGLGLLSAQTHWGSYGGPTSAGAQEGVGVIRADIAGNSLMLRRPCKGIIRLPFESFLHQVPPEHRVTPLRIARTMSIGVIDGVRGFIRSMRDTSIRDAMAQD